jgi:hypothetical protein
MEDIFDLVYSNECMGAYSEEKAGGLISNVKDYFSLSFKTFGAKDLIVKANFDKNKAITDNINNNKETINKVLESKGKDKFIKFSDANGKYKSIVTSKLNTIVDMYTADKLTEHYDILINVNGIAIIGLAKPLMLRRKENSKNIKLKMWWLVGIFALKINQKEDDASIFVVMHKKLNFGNIDTTNRTV